MAVYEYIAKDCDGNKLSGVYTDVNSKEMLKRGLDKMGYALVKAKRKNEVSSKRKPKVTSSQIISFAYEFSGMYSAGLPILRCLQTIESQLMPSDFKDVMVDIRVAVESGSTLKEAFEKYTYIFSEFFVSMVESGEAGGRLVQTLQMAAQYLEQQAEVKAKVKNAFAYPVIVSVMCFVIVTALIVFVIPVFQKLYGQLHVQLPLPTKCIIALSEAVKSYWPFLVTLIVGSVFGLPKLLKRPDVKSRMDRLKLKLPLVGNLNRMIIVSRYVQTFAMMTSAGIPIVDALAFARKVANNSVFDDASNGIEQQVQAGNSLADSMSKYSIFPSSIINLADAGEKAGILSQMLLKGTEVLDKKIGRAIDSLLTKIEPVMSVLLGLIVGSIMLGVYLPMFDYMGQIK